MCLTSVPPVISRQDYAIMDTVLSAPRSSYPDIVKLTEKNVQSGNINDLKVLPGYYTVATDRGECLCAADLSRSSIQCLEQYSYLY